VYKFSALTQDAVRDADFAPGAATWRTERSIAYIFDCSQFAQLYENMTSFTKPEITSVLYCCQRKTEPRPQVWDMRAEGRTDRQTDTLIAILRAPYLGEAVMINIQKSLRHFQCVPKLNKTRCHSNGT